MEIKIIKIHSFIQIAQFFTYENIEDLTMIVFLLIPASIYECIIVGIL